MTLPDINSPLSESINWITLKSVDSTNNEAKRQFEAGNINQLTCIVAKRQLAGKGTQGRQWASPEGGLYFSLVFPGTQFNLPIETPYTRLAGKACQSFLNAEFNLAIQLKGINDLVVEENQQIKKLGGILTESIIRENIMQVLIVGIGINIHSVPTELNDHRNSPISLEDLISDFSAINAKSLITQINNKFLALVFKTS